jgi:GNAT superfamily N-acetyltransferase
MAVIRDARREDVAAIVELYRSDELSRKHDNAPGAAVPDGYYAVFDAIQRDTRNRLLVAEVEGVVAGSFQITLLPDMTPDARDNMLVENVIVGAELRGRRVGEAMMRWAIDEARRLGCSRVQLTSRDTRPDAHRFYERLGFTSSHRGFRYVL